MASVYQYNNFRQITPRGQTKFSVSDGFNFLNYPLGDKEIIMKDQRQIDEEAIIREFIESTPIWVESLHPTLEPKDKPCVVCGVVPENLLKVAKAAEHLL